MQNAVRSRETTASVPQAAGSVRTPLSAATADRHVLYEAAVQSVDFELEFFQKIFRRKRGRRFHDLREDFCGTARLAATWVAQGKDHRAIAVDLHRPTLEWGRHRHVEPLGPAASRIRLVCANVLDVRSPKVDLLAAMNYSYWTFRERGQLLRYLRTAHASLRRDGILILDAFGGTESTVELEEERRVEASIGPDGRRIPSFTYVWEQARFNPLTGELLCRIHFKFRDGSRMERAFTYRWRYWTIPELRELLGEAGFRSTEVYVEGWDDEEDESDGIFRPRKRLEEMAGWIAYVVALK